MTATGNPCIVLHRALFNAGDFLIRDRTLRLLERHRPELPVVLGKAWIPLASQFDADIISQARAVVVCGGPGYQPGMYPRVYPLAPLDALAPPVFLTALGSYAMRDPANGGGGLDEASIRFLRFVQSHGGRLGARDELTRRMLSQFGVDDVAMTGDPAWYDLDWLGRDRFVRPDTTVAFTPPANPLFHRQGAQLLRAIAVEYGASNVRVVFHRHRQTTFARIADDLGLEMVEITGGADKFDGFDRVGLHIGYRVHAHLYCLSHETPSYLVAEDSRGLGVLGTLGDLGADGFGERSSWIAERLWSTLPRIGSDRSEASRRLGLAVSALARLPDISAPLLSQVASDRAQGYVRHVEAKAVIRDTYPRMVEMLGSIP